MMFINEYPRDYEKRQNEVSKKRYMGSKSEMKLSPQFERLRVLDFRNMGPILRLPPWDSNLFPDNGAVRAEYAVLQIVLSKYN